MSIREHFLWLHALVSAAPLGSCAGAQQMWLQGQAAQWLAKYTDWRMTLTVLTMLTNYAHNTNYANTSYASYANAQ